MFGPEDDEPIPYELTEVVEYGDVERFWDTHVCDATCRPKIEEVRGAFRNALNEGLNNRG